MKALRHVPTRYRVAALVHCGISIFLLGVAATLSYQHYQVAVNPHVMGRIERTWLVTRRGKASSQTVRVADITFPMTVLGKPIDCRVEARDIGSETFVARAGDSIELSPIPGGCKTPYVLNVVPPTWVLWGVVGIVVVTALLFALFGWAVLSDAGSRLSLSVRRAVDRRSGV